MTADHACPVAYAADHGLLNGSPITPTTCLSYWRDLVMNLYPVDATDPQLEIWRDGPLSMHYAPFDWVNTAARVMLVGITPGAHQATEALREAQACLREGLPIEETLRRADATGAFSGPMRKHLVTLLDGIGLAEALGIESTAQLFGTHHRLAALASAIDFPVFRNGENYRGSSPHLTRHPVLRALVRASLGARVVMTPGALIIPLGTAAGDAVSLLAADGLADEGRVLTGFPHPSGGNGHRTRIYQANRAMLSSEVARWARSRAATAHR